MPQIIEKIIVDAPIHLTYNAYYDITNWTKILSDVVSVDIIVNELDYQEFYITVLKNGLPEKVHTIRECKINQNIKIKQLIPPPQVTFMNGKWEFKAYNETQTIICATRTFAVKKTYNEKEYIKKLTASLKQNLYHFKNYLEGVGVIRVQRILDTSSEQAISLFWDLENWNKIWNPIIKTKCSFDNNYLQEFLMELEHNNETEIITGVQLLKENSIAFYNILCPNKLSLHFGSWQFDDVENGVLVTANRIFRMQDAFSDEFISYKYNLQNRIGNILECFKDYYQRRELISE